MNTDHSSLFQEPNGPNETTVSDTPSFGQGLPPAGGWKRHMTETQLPDEWPERAKHEVWRLDAVVSRYQAALVKIAAPIRPDGTYNLSREACEQACCGGRMWWWDKAHPLAVYLDCREEPKGAHPARPNWHLSPDVLGDFRALPFDDGAFQLVLFDPPHNVRENPSGIYSLYYGALQPDTEQDDLRRGFAECWRVLAPGGTLVFKWAGKVARVNPHFPATPIVGTRSNQMSGGLGTRWFVFYKPLDVTAGEVAA